MSVSALPIVNALLNTASAVLLLTGHQYLKKGNTASHKKLMIAAFITSSLFLVSYITYHSIHGAQYFQGEGWSRPVYFLILGTHTVLAASIVPLAIITLRRGLKSDFMRHRKIAKWTYPIWVYVSVTGVIIYLMLYQLFPG